MAESEKETLSAEQQAAIDEAAEQEAFEATMAELAGGESKAPELVQPKAEPEPESEVVPETEPKADDTTSGEDEVKPEVEEPPERVEIFEGFTKEELKAKLDLIPSLQKTLDKTNGTFGNQLQTLKAEIAALKETKTKVEEPKAKRTLKVSENYPEVGEDLSHDFDDLEQRLTAKQQAIVDKLEADKRALQAEQQRLATDIKMKEETRILQTEHPDWEDIAVFDEQKVEDNGKTTILCKWRNLAFGNWVAQQDPDVQNQIINGSDARYLADRIADYKATLAPKPKPAKAKTNKLGLALVPESASDTASNFATDDDVEEQAYREMMRKIAMGEA